MNSFILLQFGARAPAYTAGAALQSIQNQVNDTRFPFLQHATCVSTTARRASEVISVHMLLLWHSLAVKSWAVEAL